MRMLLVGYCFGIRSQRRLCDEVHLNLAYRGFCRLGFDGRVVSCCMDEGFIGGGGSAFDGSPIKADANRQSV
ncbi:transposase [Rhizobium sp. BE258]|nr:transposase [Rhizobium sp. BE258]MDR7144740.1 transposase [Rhizobium sp. BE258]